MYDFIFISQGSTLTAGLVLLVIACAITSHPGFWWRPLALNFIPVFSAGFMVAILLSNQVFSAPDVIAAIVFEFVVLALFCRVTYLSYGSLHTVSAPAASRAMILFIMLYAASFAPVALSGGFGIFSVGTRIDYLYESSAAKYITYGSLILSLVLGGLLARRITLHRRPQLLDYCVILIVTAASVLAGSKGSFILWIGAVLALIDYRQAQIRPRTVLLAAAAMAVLITILAVVVSDFLRLSIPEFFDLAFSRFFLNNDARALAFEMRTLEVHPGLSLFSEAFRSVGSLLGNPPRNAPLGAELYDAYFGPSGGAGANGSLTAMIIYYSTPGYAVLPLVIATLATLPLWLIARIGWSHMPTAFARFTIQAVVGLNLVLLSQDFLAFQVVLPLTVILGLIFFISEGLHVIANKRPNPIVR